MTEQNKNKSKLWIVALIVIIVLMMVLFASGMINITVLDTAPFENLTINITLT